MALQKMLRMFNDAFCLREYFLFVLKSDLVPYSELADALSDLPTNSSGLPNSETLALWQLWHRNGNLKLGRVERVLSDGSRQTQALGITLWITDTAAQALSQPSNASCCHRLYRSHLHDPSWVMTGSDIQVAHDSGKLNLMVLHFWSRGEVTSPDFQPVFLQAHMLFRDLHQGFGVQALYQEVTQIEVPFLTAAGMALMHSSSNTDPASLAWMGITRAQAAAKPGSTFSFLFMSPERRLALHPAVQRMLTLAVKQITDEEIADALGCSRDYVRKLWTQAYHCMEQTGVLTPMNTPVAGSSLPVRGRERRRTAIEFMRANPHEMRPGLPTKRRTALDSRG